MQFNSIIFFIFFSLVLILYYTVKVNKRNLVLLISNYIFYSYFDPRFAALLFVLTSITFFIGKKIFIAGNYESKRKLLLLGVIVNISVLGIFKYLNFFSESFVTVMNILGLQVDPITIKLIQPLGISFYIFQTLTWLFNIYYEQINNEYNFIEFAVFASFFPTVVAGPIERANRLMPQIKSQRQFDKKNLRDGFFLIVYGLFRKVLIGDTIGRMINHIYADPQYFTSFEIISAILLYSIQIYNDFAGYSSIARGVAKSLGFEIMLNFRQPYFSVSIADFWRRWHISFSTWLRDYIFSPLQLKYRYYKKWGNLFAIIITFSICGLWHGASWNFILWGFLHGVLLSFPVFFKNSSLNVWSSNSSLKKFKFGSILTTYFLVSVLWVLFRSENVENVTIIFNQILTFTGGEFILRFTKITLSYYLVSFLLDFFEIKLNTDNILSKIKPAYSFGISLVTLIMIISYLITSDKSPFIYARF